MRVPTIKINPVAKAVRQPKFKQQVIPDKKKPKPLRKQKHKGDKYNAQIYHSDRDTVW